MPEPVEGTSPYIPGLDGLRAIAVVAVIAYHLHVGWAPGGLLGVGVFFVLSGYLITDLLVAEYHRHRGIGLKQFWVRRARRLLPALFAMLVVTVGWATLFDRVQLPALRSDLPAAVFYVSNWWFIFHHVSYFAKFGPPSPLGHLWSLAIEEQFYLVWPLLLFAGLRWVRSTRTLLVITLTVAVASAVEMGLLYSPGGDPTRVYDGTDTRAFGLLIGAALALAWPRHRTFASVTPGGRRVLEAVGGIALIGIFVMFWQTDQYEPFLYRGGMVLLSVLTALVIAATIHPGGRLRSVLGWEPLRWVGERSYALYLWHYPVIVLTTPPDARPDLLRAVLQVGASVVLAALSWRYIEQPVRHRALERLWGRFRQHEWSWGRLWPKGWLVAGSMAALVLLCTAGLSGLVTAPAADPASEVTSITPPVHRPHPAPASTAPASTAPSSTAPSSTAPSPSTAPGATTPATTAPPTSAPASAGQGVTAIGDSIMIDASPYLQQDLPGIVIDARVGQQLYQVQNAVPTLHADGDVGHRLIIELGTNGPFSASQLETLLHSLGPMQKIVLVNTRVPRPWQNQVNDTIASVAHTYPNTTMVDWYADSAAYPQYFYPDGVHLDPEGAKYLASLLVQALDAPVATSDPPPPQ